MSRPPTSIALRSYRPEDLASLLLLWDAAHARLAGYVPRTAEYWQWRVLDRPGVGRDNVLVAEHTGTPAGYAALDTAGKEGDVLEFVVDPLLPGRARRELAALLIGALEERSRTLGQDIIRLHVPVTDAQLGRVLRFRGYSPKAFEPLQWAIVDLPALLSALLAAHRDRLPAGWSTVVTLDVEPGGQRSLMHWRVAVDAANAHVAPTRPGRGEPQKTVVRTDLPTLTSVVFRATTFDEAMAAGDLTVDPPQACGEAKTLFGLLTLTRPWFTPLAEVR